MKIRTKLLFLLTVGVLVPVLLSHFFSARAITVSMDGMIRDEMVRSISMTSERMNDRVRWMVDGLGLVVESVPFESFPPEALHDALAIPYRQLADATMVALLDDGGKAVVAPYRPDDEEVGLMGRRPVTDADLDRFSMSVPLELSLTATVAIGPVHGSDSGEPRVVVAAAFPVDGEENRWVLAVEFSLAPLCEMVRSGEAGDMVLLDGRGYSLCVPWKDSPVEAADAEKILGTDLEAAITVGDGHGEVVRAVDEIDLTGWRISLERPESDIMSPLRNAMTQTAVWVVIAVLIAAVGGVVLARGLSRPITELESASLKMAAGQYDQRLEITSSDEVGSLARAFNAMAEEISAWNLELTHRVDERTRELKEAQAQILQTQKLAAVGELGAGVAHEINNPLTGVIGLAQLLKAEASAGSEMATTLEEIIGSAKRAADVVHELLRYSQSQLSQDMNPVDMKEVLEKSVWMFEGRFEASSIAVEWDAASGCVANGVEADLRLAFNNILDNALKSMPDGGTLRLSVGRIEGGAIKTVISDEGVGMSSEEKTRAMDPFYTTAPPGSGSRGMGLSTVHRVIESHGGRIVIDSQVGEGTRVTVFLPGRVMPSKS